MYDEGWDYSGTGGSLGSHPVLVLPLQRESEIPRCTGKGEVNVYVASVLHIGEPRFAFSGTTQ